MSGLSNSHDAIVLSIGPCGSNCGKVLVVGDNLADGTADLYTPDLTPPITCFVSAIRAGPPKQMDVIVQDIGGLAAITNIRITNGVVTTSPSPIPHGFTGPVVVTATKIDQNQPTVWSFDAVDTAGNVKHCA